MPADFCLEHGYEFMRCEKVWGAIPYCTACEEKPPTLCGQIAAIYEDLDAEDCKMVDREWARMRGYILPTDGTSTIAKAGT